MRRALPILCVALMAGTSTASSLAQSAATQPARTEAAPVRTAHSSQFALQQRLSEFKAEGIPFDAVIAAIARSSGANFHVKWNQLELAGIGRETPVSVQLRNVTLAKALDVILDSVETGDVSLGYYVHENVITIGVSASRRTNLITRVYDMTDLMFRIPDIEPGAVGSAATGSGGGNRSDSGGGNRSSSSGGGRGTGMGGRQ